jgi:nucleoside-diphosphate-sugar epimerase
MKVFVAGATGVVGNRAVARLVDARHEVTAVARLVDARHEVTAVARSAEKAELVRSLGATPVHVSLFDRDGLTAALAGHDAVVTLATKIPSISHALAPGAWDENNRIRTEGSATLVDAAIAAGVSRYVQESITFTYPDGGDAWIDAPRRTSTHPGSGPAPPTPRRAPPASPRRAGRAPSCASACSRPRTPSTRRR